MSSITSTYQNVIDSYQKFSSLPENNSQFRTAQKTLFTSIAALYPSVGLSAVEALEKDVFYHQAKLVCQGVTFQNHPGSLNRLRPLANNYCRDFNEIISSLRQPPAYPIALKEKLETLGKSHLQFAQAYLPELNQAAPENSTVIGIKHSQTLHLFLEVIFPHLQQFKDAIEEREGQFLTLTLPCLSIEKLLTNPAQTPEFFLPYYSSIFKKSKTWEDLSSIEKDHLHRKILGEDIELSPVTEQLYNSIRSIGAKIHEDHAKRNEFNLVAREAFQELQNALLILAALPKKRTNPAKDLIYAILSNTEIAIPNALYQEKYTCAFKALREKGANSKEIEKLASLIVQETKAFPWLALISPQ